MQPFTDTRNPYEVTRKIFADCDGIYKEEIAKAKRKRLRKRFKRFITMQVYNVRNAKHIKIN